jgi:hypothetical protein
VGAAACPVRSSTIRFETTEGRVWFKVNASGTAYDYRRLLDELGARPTEDGGLTREEASAIESLIPLYDDRCGGVIC